MSTIDFFKEREQREQKVKERHHQAYWACVCGNAIFFYLYSGKLECTKCGKIQDGF